MPRRVCERCGKSRDAKFFAPRGRVCSLCQRAARAKTTKALRLLATYLITMEEYEAIGRVQGHVCAVCGEPRRYELHVDHDHAVERERGVRASVRGLLCKRCNKLLRDCRDSVPLLRALIDYLTDPPARKVLDATSSV